MLNSGGGAVSAMTATTTTQAVAGGLGFATFALFADKVIKDKSVTMDLDFLSKKIQQGPLAASNEINSTGLGARLNIQAGFVDSFTFAAIQKRGELDLRKDNINSIKYLPLNGQTPMGSNDKPYPYLLIYPNSEPKTKNFFILPVKQQ